MSLAIALLLFTVTLPPLTHEQQVRLDTARDGRDHREEAFIALLENAGEATEVDGDEPIDVEPDIDAMLAAPDAYRGALVRLSGRLEQRTSLGSRYEGVEEWFVRDAGNRPIIVFVVDAPSGDQWREGRRVSVLARFYKRIDATDRRGMGRQYAAFVGTRPQLIRHSNMTAELWVLLVPVVFLLLAFALVLVYVRRQRGTTRRVVRHLAADAELDEPCRLPDDPASALAELRRRAE